ncbi:MAG: type II toxin-antitoxin system VapC family toxin [Candidatus Melainabacteria bacterium]|nr:type II toxin-antitoxin system VapC family toxin [Candidatus Melainabacteria bacterium]
MNYLLDTNFLIGFLRKKIVFIEKLDELRKLGKLYISAITVTEIYAGCREKEFKETEELINRLQVIPLSRYTAKEAGKLIYKFARFGKTIQTNDVIIGVTAKIYHLVLVTKNTKDFQMLYPSQIEEFPK